MTAVSEMTTDAPAGVTLYACEGCCWPVGRADRTTFFCDAPRVAEGSYCDTHHAVAYRPAPLTEILP